jgi:hypothetical protein
VVSSPRWSSVTRRPSSTRTEVAATASAVVSPGTYPVMMPLETGIVDTSRLTPWLRASRRIG